ncbi:DNA-binding transcriptional regulator, MerR family [Alkalibacterium putridalgicola]|uniref:DNA-binding transcriptional regulator, MerR family n=1 Tax=Alkalibacterium putridalgicola TaxID=426703 RepID=A0A1H7V836_9LACT|nr:MerR family transcriptional regulator [Alkalibacterium putridalgicola]GEK89743.1 MerR family transcriptional regulator [Alkalibacterium putridalgicola]SEM05174.1 DNA-binding transcriptional regulator, MerR family [Alkalibacterium putridalgicola]
MYTVKELGDLTGLSSRTLRYYDSINLLSPAELSESGYRLYDKRSVDRLQQILFYRERGLPLKEIKRILDDPSFDEIKALQKHRRQLIEEQKKLSQLISTLEKTLIEKKGTITMSDKEKFEGFKKVMVDENSRIYGEEVEAAYGSEKLNKANKQILKMSEKDFDKWKILEKYIISTLKNLLERDVISDEEKSTLGGMHREWLSFTWDTYSTAMHEGLVEMYLADDRFKAYYDDRAGNGAAEVLVNAVKVYTKELHENQPK